MTTITDADREAAAKVHPNSHNSALILDGERDGTDIVRAAAYGREAAEARVAGEIVAIIAKHGVASCNCLTKTPQAAFHLETCPYQRIALILDEIDERGDHKGEPA